MSDTEIKRLPAVGEVKLLSEQGDIEGYGAVFGNVDMGDDMIVPGAFTKTLDQFRMKNRWPAFLHSHNSDQIAGVWKEMRQDDRGLYCKGQFLMATQCGRDRYEEAKAGALTGLSIGYRVPLRTNPNAREFRADGDRTIRVLKEIDIIEVSAVAVPMNDMARISGVKGIKTIREFEDFLRDVGGFSNNAAKAIAARGFKAQPDPRDEAGDGNLSALLASIRRAAGIIQKPKE